MIKVSAFAIIACAIVASLACNNQADPTLQPAAISSATPTPGGASTSLPERPLASPTPTQTPPLSSPLRLTSASIGETLTFDTLQSPPKTDIYDLARRLMPGVSHEPPPPPEYDEVGDAREFNALNLENLSSIVVSAELCATSAHADFYVETRLNIPCSVFEDAAALFEDEIYPRVMSEFVPMSAQQKVARIALIHADIPGVGGYYDSGNLYPVSIRPDSNERPILYLSAGRSNASGDPRHPGYASLVAHEFQHAVHDLADPYEATWVNEGLSVLAGAAYDDGRPFDYFLWTCGPTHLAAWPVQTGAAACNYAGSGLFMLYLRHNYPDGNGALRGLVADPNPGIRGIDSYLRDAGYDTDALSVFAEWGAANYLDGRSGLVAYQRAVDSAPVSSVLTGEGSIDGPFVQFAPTYIGLDLSEDVHRIEFRGDGLTPLTKVASLETGAFWQAGGTDSADYSLTRPFDLRSVDPEDAILKLLLKLDIEENWDFLYVLGSSDEGETWSFLESHGMSAVPRTAPAWPFGPAFTGISGGGVYPQWIMEEFDLSGLAGHEILIRLEYVTDPGVSLDGVSLGGAWLPAVEYAWPVLDGDGINDAVTETTLDRLRGGWSPEGFFFSNNLVEQSFVVRLLIVSESGEASVMPIDLDKTGNGSILFDNTVGSVREAAVMIFPMAPLTRQPANGTLTLSMEPAAGQ